MKNILVFALAITATLAVPKDLQLHQKWSKFKATYNKSYAYSAEEVKRLQIFQNNVAKIEAHNKKYERGQVTYRMGINQFSDMSKEEFLGYVNRGRIHRSKISKKLRKPFIPSDDPLPAEVDWRTKNIVTEVKNQGQCRSCWAFSVTGALESQLALNGHGLISLSEQNLVDCTTSNYGCGGGWMDNAFDYIHDNGIEKESDYPYEHDDGLCRFNATLSVTSLSGYVDIPRGSEFSLQQAVAQAGPVAVAIDASYNLHHYESGYFYDDSCSNHSSNHEVLVVGYGSRDEGDYWIVKNSWGSDWGESGYFMLARNADNNCGVASHASYPLL